MTTISNDELLQLKSAIGTALVFLSRYKERREDDLQMHLAAQKDLSTSVAKDDIERLTYIITTLAKTQ